MLTDLSHLVSLFENANEGFVVTGASGRIVLVNPSACRMFGYTPEELVGQRVEMMMPPKYRDSHVQMRNGFYEHPRNRVMGHGRDLEGITKDGRRFPLEASLSTYIHNGEQFVTAFIVDITARKQIEQSLKEQQSKLEQASDDMRSLNAALEAKVEERTLVLQQALKNLERSQQELSEALDKERQLNEIKSRFVSMASHEFLTPLSTVLSSTILLSKYTLSDEQPHRAKHITKIKASVKHLNDLLNDFLSLGKLDEGKIGANLGMVNLKKLVSETAEEIKVLTKQKQRIIIEYVGAEQLISDERFLKNILINLLSNAIKFSDEGSDIFLRVSNQGRTEIQVTDNGIGIPEDEAVHLFSSFFRARNAQNIQGTGLGLHIVKRYVDLLGGTIDARSALNSGTTITISLPSNS
ncbi:MAG: PAS domain S-box protein [Chitinophagaceae bacterium]|nr:MAG: PAS domain S-box protein [Chitinophagaceae bacterium]